VPYFVKMLVHFMIFVDSIYDLARSVYGQYPKIFTVIDVGNRFTINL